MITTTKCQCLECGGVAYLTKLNGMYAFCPMCGEEVTCNQELTRDVFISETNASPKLTVINQTDYTIDFVSGIKEEHTVLPDQRVEIEIEDGDYMYIDQAFLRTD